LRSPSRQQLLHRNRRKHRDPLRGLNRGLASGNRNKAGTKSKSHRADADRNELNGPSERSDQRDPSVQSGPTAVKDRSAVKDQHAGNDQREPRGPSDRNDRIVIGKIANVRRVASSGHVRKKVASVRHVVNSLRDVVRSPGRVGIRLRIVASRKKVRRSNPKVARSVRKVEKGDRKVVAAAAADDAVVVGAAEVAANAARVIAAQLAVVNAKPTKRANVASQAVRRKTAVMSWTVTLITNTILTTEWSESSPKGGSLRRNKGRQKSRQSRL
jgi:hypothetical protein